MGDDNVQEVEVIPTGSIALNAALGVGGYPKGRIIEIYGPESSGKTTLLSTPLLKLRRQVALQPSLMPNMLSTVFMRPN